MKIITSAAVRNGLNRKAKGQGDLVGGALSWAEESGGPAWALALQGQRSGLGRWMQRRGKAVD